jgi:DNA-binding protein HU-beta
MKKSPSSSKAMNKQTLIFSISEISHFSKKDATLALDAVTESITLALKEEKEVKLQGFGTFSVHLRPATTGKNPRTGEALKIPARKVLKFKPNSLLKKEIS